MRPRFGPGGHTDAAWHIAGMVIWLVLLAALVVLVVLLVRRLSTGSAASARALPPWPPRSAALDELELRYARGEIAREEYLGRRADLQGSAFPLYGAPPGPPPPPAGPPPQAPPPA